MFSSLLITFRETLEAALIIGIVLSYLNHIKRTEYHNAVYVAVGAAVLSSVILAILFELYTQGFTGRNEEIFEGVTMILASLFLTWMLIWMGKQKNISAELKKKVEAKVNGKYNTGIFFLVFFAVMREGIETILFLKAASFNSEESQLAGGLIGVGLAIILGYMIFVALEKISLKKFFFSTTILLGLFATGLFAHGIHEFQEAGVVPIYKEHVWDINPPTSEVNGVTIYPLLHEKGAIGGIMKDLLGYNGNPSLIEVLSYIGFGFFISLLYIGTQRKKKLESVNI